MVWVVIRSGKIAAIYDNEAAAITHQKNLIKQWSLASVQCHQVLSV